MGYDESHTHLHVWIARNFHAPCNFGEPACTKSTIQATFTPTMSTTTLIPGRTGLYETFFRYGYLLKMGEIKQSPDTDGDGYVNAHSWEWFDHWYHEPAWHDLRWLPFRGRLDKYWCKKPDGTVVTRVLLFEGICTPSPQSLAWRNLNWMHFSDNLDCAGGRQSRPDGRRLQVA